MRKSLLTIAISGALIASFTAPVNAQAAGTLEQRVDRLERMLENPVLLQLSRRLGEQQREIQQLQDENDRLKRELQQFKDNLNTKNAETDERLSRLEGGNSSTNGVATTTVPAWAKTPVSTPINKTKNSQDQGGSAPSESSKPGLETKEQLEDVAKEPPKPSENSTVSKKDKAESKPVTTETKVEGATKVEQKSAAQVVKTHRATEQEKSEYRQAFALMGASKYSESIQAFETFLSTYPASSLASNAAYWAGEGYLLKGKNQQALESFMMVLNRYPDSSKVPDATLRAGDSYAQLGQTKKAQEMYRQLIAERPHHKAAKTAQKRLKP